jgi:hypothetical protein
MFLQRVSAIFSQIWLNFEECHWLARVQFFQAPQFLNTGWNTTPVVQVHLATASLHVSTARTCKLLLSRSHKGCLLSEVTPAGLAVG